MMAAAMPYGSPSSPSLSSAGASSRSSPGLAAASPSASASSSGISRVTPPPPPPPPNRYRKDPRLAALYDRDIQPVWTQPFGRLLLSRLPPLAGKATVLDVMCHTGYPALEILRRYPQARVFAIDPSSALLDVARAKAGTLSGRRIFFRTEPAEPTLPFDDEVYDLVVSNLGLHDAVQPRLLLRDMARVAKRGARVVATLPLRGSFAEFHALVEALVDDRPRERARLRQHLLNAPDAGTLTDWATEAGLVDVRIDVAPFSLLFAGGADLFFAPVIEYGPLCGWKTVLGERGPQMQADFQQLKAAIDKICGAPGQGQGGERQPLVLTVRAACLSARKPLPEGMSDGDDKPAEEAVHQHPTSSPSLPSSPSGRHEDDIPTRPGYE